MSGIREPQPGRYGSSSFPVPATENAKAPDRRDADRFPIQRDMRYRLNNKRDGGTEGVGQTLNISSNGVLFRSSDPSLLPGKRIELSISWPARLDNRCNLRLVARGRIARIVHDEVAVEIDQYEFRTAGRVAPE
jgi:hypothetical protein